MCSLIFVSNSTICPSSFLCRGSDSVAPTNYILETIFIIVQHLQGSEGHYQIPPFPSSLLHRAYISCAFVPVSGVVL
uniref:Uncharacterized protein n=1 Tax=Octopus bimaculoides TaxID=37653 RepID=A0A0L8G1J3_OCTBM